MVDIITYVVKPSELASISGRPRVKSSLCTRCEENITPHHCSSFSLSDIAIIITHLSHREHLQSVKGILGNVFRMIGLRAAGPLQNTF